MSRVRFWISRRNWSALGCCGMRPGQAGLCVAVTHDLNLALTYCTRLLVLDQGRVARDLTGAEDGEWLKIFSPALRLGRTETGAPWVWYT